MRYFVNSDLCTLMQINRPTCEFREKRLLLGTVPLNLTTIRTVHIENKGNCHAYFKVNLVMAMYMYF